MPKYLVTIHRPHGYDPSVEDEVMSREIDELNDEMVAAGIRVFVGGLQLPDSAASVRLQADGTLAVSSGHYLQCDEFVGGLWVLQVADMDEALEWGRKAARACRCGVEVRPFH
jgi:hypothetical protein